MQYFDKHYACSKTPYSGVRTDREAAWSYFMLLSRHFRGTENLTQTSEIPREVFARSTAASKIQ